MSPNLLAFLIFVVTLVLSAAIFLVALPSLDWGILIWLLALVALLWLTQFLFWWWALSIADQDNNNHSPP